MTNSKIASRLACRIAFGSKKVLGGAASVVLLSAGLAGVAAPAVSAGHAGTSGITLAASTDTVIGNYSNSKAKISVKKRTITNGSDTIVAFISDIVLTEGTALQSAFANDSFARGSTETVPSMAKRKRAAVAVNGDYSSFRMNGIIISGGQTFLDKGKRPGFAVRRDGTAMIYDEKSTNAASLLADNVWLTQSFGPGLVVDGVVPDGIDTYEIDDFGDVDPGAPGSIQGKQPRTGIGYIEKNHFIMIEVDGRGYNNSRGATMVEFAQLFVDAGATLAYNLDGGGSATMYFNGVVVNKPSDGSPRATSNMVYVAK